MIQKKLLLFFALLSFYNSSFAQIPAVGNVLWLKADAAVYTDAGVTLATNGQTVQQWNDQSGGNKHATQATLAMRPTFVTSSINSLPALHFTSSMLVTPNIDFSTTDKSDVYIIYKSSTPNPAGQCILELSPDINTNQSFDLFENLTGVTYTGFWTGVSGNVGLNAQTYPVKADVFKIVNSTYDKSIAGGSETFLRINGKDMTLASGYAYNNNTNNYSNQPIYIGNRGASLAYALNGDIAEIIIYDRKLTPAERTQVDSYLQIKYNITCGAQASTVHKPGSGNALIFPGTGSYGAQVGDDDDFYWGTGDFAIEAWINPTGSGQDNCIMTQSVGGAATPGTSSFYWSFNYGGANTMAMALYTTSGTTWDNVIYTAPNALTAGKWQHIAVTRTAGVTKLYVNGIAQTTTGTVFNNIQNATQPIGFGIQNGTALLGGWLDEIRFYKGAAPTQTIIRDWMCKKTTVSHPNYANMVAYYDFDEDANKTYALDKINCHDAYLIGTTVHVTSGAALGDVSSYQYAINNATANINFGTPTDNLTAAMNAGTSEAVHVYGVNELPNNQNYPGINGNNKYAGVYVVKGNGAAAYTATYNYINNATVTPGIEPALKLFKRTDNAATTWSLVTPQTLNTVAKTITATGQNTEYVLGTAVTPVAPSCYGSFPNAGDLLNRTDLTSSYTLLDNNFDNFTYEIWVNPTQPLGPGSTSGDQYVIWPEQAAGLGRSGIGIGVAVGTNGIRVYGHTAAYLQVQLGYTATITSWTHIAVVYANQIPTIYVNGLAVASGTANGVARASDGYMYTDTYGHYYGQTTDFRLWNYARTGAQINAGMNTPPTANASGLQAMYQFNNLYNGAGQLINNSCTNLPALQLNKITAGTNTTPAFNCTGQNFPTLVSPTCGIQFGGTSKVTVGNAGNMPAKGTVEFWLKPKSFSNYQSPLIMSALPGGSNNGLYFWIDAAGTINGLIGNSDPTYSYGVYGTLAANKYAHVVMTWDVAANNMKGYLDGRLVFSKTNTYWPATLPNFMFGTGRVTATDFFNGDMDEVRFWTVERTQAEIISSASSVTGSETGLKAYYHFNENTIGGNGRTVLNKATATVGTLDGTTVSTNGYPKFPCSLNPPTCGIKLSGAAGEGVNIPHNATLNMTTAYTYEAWFKASTNITNYRAIINKGANPNYDPAIFINSNGDPLPGRISAYFNIGGILKVVSSSSIVNDNEWHHVATTYDGTNMKIYIDGGLENTVAATGVLGTNTEPLGIGYNYTANNYPFIGTIDEVRVWNIARTDVQIQSAMNGALAGNESGLVAYYNISDNNRSGQNRTVTNFCTATGSILNGTTSGTSLTPVFECAPPPFTEPECNMQVNGTTDYAQASNTAAINIPQFSAGAYFKTTVTGTTKTILLKDVDGTNHNYQLSLSSTNKAVISFTNTAATIISATGTTTITDGNWHYAVGTYDGANLKIYVDGVLEATTANATTPMTGANALNIGVGNGGLSKFNGSIDELSVWNTALSLAQIQNLIGQRLAGNETGLVAYYNFGGNAKNGQGITIINSCTATGAALNAITAGTATTPIFTCSEIIVTAPACNLLMNGFTDRAYVNGTGALSYPGVTNNFTMEVKAKALYPKGNASGAQYDGVFSGQNYVLFPDQGGDGFAPGHAGVGISLGTNGIAVYEHSSNYMPARIAFNNYNTNDWVHLTVVSSNGILKLYINGALVSTASASGYVLHPSGHIGGYYGTFAGYVGEVRIWNAALNADQIRTNLNANLVGNETNLISLFKFNNNTSNGTNKTITGLGSFGSVNPYITSGTNCTPIFTCANTTTVNRDNIVGSGSMLSQNGSGISFAELGDLGNIPTQGSLMAWFNAASLKEKAFIFSTAHFRNSVGRYKGINLFTRSDGKLQMTFGTDTTATGYQDTVTVSTNITAGRWYHFAMSWDTVAKTYTAYLNGIQTASGSTNFWPVQFESFKAGIGLQPSSTNTWNGQIDELSEWNKILSVAEIRNQLASKINTAQANYANVMHYYRFDNNTCSANAISDYKGTVHGMVYNTSLPASSAPIGAYSSYQYAGSTSVTALQIGNGQGGTDNVTATLNAGASDGIHVYGEDMWPNTVNGVVDTLTGSKRYAGVFVVNPNAAAYSFVYDYTNNPYVTPINEPYLKLKKRDNNAVTAWIAPSNMLLDQTLNTITCTGQNTEYILEKSLTIVPLKWLSFTALLNSNKQSVLNWRVTEELNVSRYEILWSIDGTNFQPIAIVNYNTAARGNYTAIHIQPANGNNYYRIKQIDVDGKYSYTNTQLVKLTEKITINIYPNPASEIINILGWDKIKQMQLYDISGRKLNEWKTAQPTISVDNLANGTYVLKVELKSGEMIEQKLVVRK